MVKQKQPASEETFEQRAECYFRTGEEAAQYMYGVADALELVNGNDKAGMIHHLRCHAKDLNMGVLYAKHGYRDVPCEPTT